MLARLTSELTMAFMNSDRRTGMVTVEDILACFPKLRKDARANVKSMLHELIIDKNATIPQIFVCTGKALAVMAKAATGKC